MTVFVNFMYKRVVKYRKNFVSTVKIQSLRLSFALVSVMATLLYRSGTVEKNPGPGRPASATRQSKLQVEREKDRSKSVDSADDSQREEPSLRDVMTLLTGLKHDMNERFDTVNSHFDSLNDSVSGLREEVTQLTAEVDKVKNENERLQTENQELADRLDAAEKKLDDLEGRSKRNNLIFRGLKKQTSSDYESWDDCEKLVKEVMHDQLKMRDDIQFDRVHRLNKDPDSPIVARFVNFKDKQRVLKEKRKLKETEKGRTIFIGEDFSKNVRDTRRKLVPHLKEAKTDKNKKVTMVYNYLLIDNKRFYLDPASGNLTESPPR